VERAFKTAREMKLSNVRFIHGKCPVQGIKEKFDFILARLTIYCSSDREDVLAWAHEILERRTRIGIIELDYDWIYTYPHNPMINKLFAVHRREFEVHGADCSMGKKVPFMLQNAGFKDIMFEVRSWWSSLELTNEQFFNLFSAYGMFSARIAPDVFSYEDDNSLIDYLNRVNLSRAGIVIYPKVVVSGIRN
ncbi:MAG TPA: hypothetical protein VLS90_14515, partial [Thermodesulfobacteriota bacterium]|nr:hypothetical protein [Thermodesulfobacteriota bacterium]